MDLNRELKILLKVEKDYIPKAEYVFRTFCRILNLKPRFYYGSTLEYVQICYAEKPQREEIIYIYHNPASADFFAAPQLYPEHRINKHLFKNKYIPFLFSLPGEIFYLSGQKKGFINKDIIASAFYFLSCWQELGCDTDERYSYFHSLQYKEEFALIPVVDYYCQIFKELLKITMPEYIQEQIWPRPYNFALSISHDIDYWEYWDKENYQKMQSYNSGRLSKHLLKALYKKMFHFVDKKILGNSTVKSTRKLIRGNVPATNFILTYDQAEDKRQNYFSEESITEQITILFQAKSLGLHASPQASQNAEKFRDELEKLIALAGEIKGNRFHFLSLCYQQTFSMLEENFDGYDASLGYWEHIGFRAGISYPFQPFNVKENRPFKILEIPLSVMDTSLHSPKAMHKSVKEAKRLLSDLVEEAATYQGHISALWHNTVFDRVDFPGWAYLFWHFIKEAKKNGAWVVSLDELYNFWIER